MTSASRSVVIGGLAPAYSVHVGADDVHFAGRVEPIFVQ